MQIVDSLMALLFASEAPARLGDLAMATGHTEGQVEQALEILQTKLEAEGPIQLVKIAAGYQLSTKPEYAEVVGAFLKPSRQRLSKSVLEVLAVVAYKQPVTVADIELVRGVQSDYGVRVLLDRNLIREVGRKQTPGRPVLYGTTPQFLHLFNLNDPKELPGVSADAPGIELPEAPPENGSTENGERGE